MSQSDIEKMPKTIFAAFCRRMNLAIRDICSSITTLLSSNVSVSEKQSTNHNVTMGFQNGLMPNHVEEVESGSKDTVSPTTSHPAEKPLSKKQ